MNWNGVIESLKKLLMDSGARSIAISLTEKDGTNVYVSVDKEG